jgi:hypothetical protein
MIDVSPYLFDVIAQTLFNKPCNRIQEIAIANTSRVSATSKHYAYNCTRTKTIGSDII